MNSAIKMMSTEWVIKGTQSDDHEERMAHEDELDRRKVGSEIESEFTNYYGGLSMQEFEGGEYFLAMADHSGNDWFGPLTDEQVKAFKVLSALKMIKAEGE